MALRAAAFPPEAAVTLVHCAGRKGQAAGRCALHNPIITALVWQGLSCCGSAEASLPRRSQVTQSPGLPPHVQVCLFRWVQTFGPLVTCTPQSQPRIAPCATVSWRAAEGLLRLLPSLPHQPYRLRDGQWRTAAEAVGAEGGLQRIAEARGAMAQHTSLMLAVATLHVGQLLLRTPQPDGGAAEAGTAQAAFELLSTACRAAHRVSPGLQAGGSVGSGAQSCLLQRRDAVDLLRLLDAAAALALRAGAAVLPTLADAQQHAAAQRCGAGGLAWGTQPLQSGAAAAHADPPLPAPCRTFFRRLECALLLYLPALQALLALELPVRDAEGAERRSALWQALLREPALAGLWRQLLSAAAAPCGAGAVGVLGDAMALACYVSRLGLPPTACTAQDKAACRLAAEGVHCRWLLGVPLSAAHT